MSMVDATERARPIMELVWQLENRVRDYQRQIREHQSRDRRFHLRWFAFGFLAGAAIVSGLALWLRW